MPLLVDGWMPLLVDGWDLSGKYTGFVTLGITYQTLENVCLRKWIGIDDIGDEALPKGLTKTGVLVVQSDPLR